jgi:hypothetical protein
MLCDKSAEYLTDIYEKSREQDSTLQRPTGIWRHRLRALLGGAEEGNTWELAS